MKYKEFLEYLENNLDGYKVFMRKAMQFQHEKNFKRQGKAKWNDEKMAKATDEMWKAAMQSLYNNLKNEIKSDMKLAWTSYIEGHDILESVNESIQDLDFANEGA